MIISLNNYKVDIIHFTVQIIDPADFIVKEPIINIDNTNIDNTGSTIPTD